MKDSEILESLVDEYLLEAGGVKFWAPYFINLAELSPDPANFKPGPFVGKGTPAQLQDWINEYANDNPGERTAEQWRQTLVENSVGVDCSGLVYYVLDNYLQKSGKGTLADQIFVDKSAITASIEAGRDLKGLTLDEIQAWPEAVSLSQFCNRTEKDPIRNANVARLESPQSTVTVDHIEDAMPGDMLSLRGPAGDHIGVILEKHDHKILYADSIGVDLKGVTKYDIKIVDGGSKMEHLDWGKDQHYVDRYQFLGLRRLKVLADA